MTSILFAGECMLELRKASPSTYQRDFAGDTYNSAVYAKLWNSQLDISFFSALGNDSISEEMIEQWNDLGLDTSHILRSPDRQPGLYAINVDEHGERSFTYWRNQSAARIMMQLLDGDYSGLTASGFDYVYVSGISFGILSDDDKQLLIDLLEALKASGAKIAYDPNYRAKMWRDNDHACQWNDRAYRVADIIFPGHEDHRDLYGHASKQDILSYLEKFGDKEVVLKCGDDGVYGYQNNGEVAHRPFFPAPVQVDSTAAGDSFAGTYLAARAGDSSVDASISAAMSVAAFVVQHQGAIAPLDAYQQFKDAIESPAASWSLG